MSLYLGNNLIGGATTPIEPTRNIGQIIQSIIPLSDAGLHLLDGALIPGSGIYDDFVQYIAGLSSSYSSCFTDETTWQNTVNSKGTCGKFVYNSTNNTVRLPKITGFIEGTVNSNELGDLINAGLPNITGAIGHFDVWGYGDAAIRRADGAFNFCDGQNNLQRSVTIQSNVAGNDYRNVDFNASRSSSIYGNSSTVQPQSIKVFYYIVIATTTKTEIEVDIDDVVTDLNSMSGQISSLNSILNSLYPVGSIYLGTQSSCPLISLIPGSTWELVSQNRALWGSGEGRTAGQLIPQGLPNITGKFGTRCLMHDTGGQVAEGALYRASTSGNIQAAGGTDWSGTNQAFGFNAANCSSIYGASDRVQPSAYVVNVWRRTA